ncbi:MAG: S8 family serine peptidase [Acidimicrobiia bacterium]|nr:S8 family serine peptidase [Acidimicrobiia bacterium]MDH4362700.1 S8 family serine peptidase [Acidimicrobiia bacterium]
MRQQATIETRGRRRLIRVVVMAGLAVLVGLTPFVGSTPAPAGALIDVAVVVKLGPGVDPAAFVEPYGLVIAAPLVPSRGIYVLELGPGSRTATSKERLKAAKDAAAALDKSSSVLYAEVAPSSTFGDDGRVHAFPRGAWSPVSGGTEVWTGQESLQYLQLGRVHTLTTGAGVTVAVIDTGADLTHPYLAGHLAGGYDFVGDDPDPTDHGDGVDNDGDGEVDEAFGHGTHTAGLVALVAPGAQILTYRVLDADGTGDPYRVAEAINDAVTAGAKVINLSFGADGELDSKVLKSAIKNAMRHEVVIVAAAGNVGTNREYSPASNKEVLSVGATDAGNGRLADFSNYGKWALVAAPGVDIVSTVPGEGFGAWSGTSMSTSIVSGEVALIRSFDPSCKRKKAIEVVGRASTKLSGRNRVERGMIDILRSLDQT